MENGNMVNGSRRPEVAWEDRKCSYLARPLIGWRYLKQSIRGQEGIPEIPFVFWVYKLQ